MAQELQTYPYLWIAHLDGRGRQVVLYRNADDVWSKPYPAGDKSAEKAMRARIATDGHAPGMFRALTVPNLDAWYPAFNVQQGQTLYLAPDQRVHVW